MSCESNVLRECSLISLCHANASDMFGCQSTADPDCQVLFLSEHSELLQITNQREFSKSVRILPCEVGSSVCDWIFCCVSNEAKFIVRSNK